MSGQRKQPSGWRLDSGVLTCLLLAGLVGSYAAALHSVSVDPDMDDEAVAAMLRQPHPVGPCTFQVFSGTSEVKGASSEVRGKKLQEAMEMQHWTEVSYGIPYSKGSEKWVDPLADTSKLVTWGVNPEGVENSAEQIHRGRLLQEEKERRLLKTNWRKRLGLTAPPVMGPSLATMNGSYFRWDSTVPPASVDWRSTEAITVVKNQGQCASCWVLAAADTISMMWAIRSGAGKKAFHQWKMDARGDPQYEAWGRLDISAQEICDCGQGGSCCQSGWPEMAYKYVMDNEGVSAWQKYPYIQADSFCKPELQTGSKAQITGWELVPARNPEAAKKAVAQQPFLAFISAGSKSFQEYLGGYYDADDCGEELNHVVVVVGYGESSKGPYWIIKNSWGTNWGDGGYMYLAARPGKGKCAIHATPGLFPTYYPLQLDPCDAYPNPCGSGTCYNVYGKRWWKNRTTPQARCGCPSGYVENNQTNPSRCVKANPCGANPNPCGGGICTNLKDGSYSCLCPEGHKISSRTDGAPTCAPENMQGGASTITIVEGTSIQDVARGYNLTVEGLVKLNPWVDPTAAEIDAGAVLAINTTATCVEAYVVQAKDTCESIAEEHSIPLVTLIQENPLANCSDLLPGTELCFSQSTTTNPSKVPPQCGQLYEVQPGDTCASVKQTMELSDDLFGKLNEGVKCDMPLDPNMVLCIATGTGPDANCTKYYTAQHGDTCTSIGLMANLTLPQFFLLNKGFRCTTPYLQVGQQVCIASSSLTPEGMNIIPYIVNVGDTLNSIALNFVERCGLDASALSICEQNGLLNCILPPAVGSLLQIPCKSYVGRSCGCAWDYAPRYGADGVWYQNQCDANCNYALPTSTSETHCKRACKARAGLTPYDDPNYLCTRPCPWPQWNPKPNNWWLYASTFCGYYIGACQDWCTSSASTAATVRNQWENWTLFYNDCVAACRSGKC